ncbi:MAG: hypothetical protein ACYTGB_18595 [Planctomycetota bacterium]
MSSSRSASITSALVMRERSQLSSSSLALPSTSRAMSVDVSPRRGALRTFLRTCSAWRARARFSR